MEESHPTRCQTEEDCELPVKVSLPKGRPGCLTLELTGAGQATRESFVQQLSLPEVQAPTHEARLHYGTGWTLPLTVVARGHDHDCSGPVLATASVAVERPTTAPVSLTLAFDDADQDGVAAASVGGGDCDDANPDVHRWAPERCNEVSDDCDRDVDEGGTCPLSLEWVTVPGSSTPLEMRVVASYGPGRVWFAGGTEWVGHRAAPDEPVVWSRCDGNGGDWLAGWARPSDGRLFLGSRGGRLTSIAPPSGSTPSTCAAPFDIPSLDPIQGLVGFAPDAGSSSGVTRLYGVTENGRVFSWDGMTAFHRVLAPANFTGIHGVDEASLLAVGSRTDGTLPVSVVYRVDTRDGGVELQEEPLTLPSEALDEILYDVHVVDPRLAYAVGSDGLLLERTQEQWKVLVRPNFPINHPELIDVVAFNPGSVYSVSWSGAGDRNIYAHDAGTWQAHTLLTAPDAGPILRAIDGWSPDDIWAVGRGGAIFHLRQPH